MATKSSVTTAHPMGHPYGFKMRKHRILVPDSWGGYQRNDFNEPRLLHLPIFRKVLNSLAWDVQLHLINSNLPCSNYLIFVVKLLCIGSSPTSLEQPLRAESLPSGLKSSETPSDKIYFSTYRLCISFSSWHLWGYIFVDFVKI